MSAILFRKVGNIIDWDKANQVAKTLTEEDFNGSVYGPQPVVGFMEVHGDLLFLKAYLNETKQFRCTITPDEVWYVYVPLTPKANGYLTDIIELRFIHEGVMTNLLTIAGFN